MATEVSTQLDRIETARDNIARAIRGKGISVPTTAVISDLAQLVADIPTGSDVSTCTVTLDLSALTNYSSNGISLDVVYTQFVDGKIGNDTTSLARSEITEVTLNNVVAGSVIYVASDIPIYSEGDGGDLNAPYTEVCYTHGVLGLAIDADITIQLYYADWMVGSCTVAGGGLSGGSAVTPTVTLSNGSDTNMANITVGAKDTTNYPYYFKVSGASSSGSSKVTRAAVTDQHTAGYIPTKAKTTVIASGSKTVTVNAGSGSTYVGVKAGACTVSGGGLSVTSNYSNTPTVDITLDGQTTSGAAITTTKPSSGYYLTIGASSSALSGTTKVTRAAVTDTHTAGYIPAKSATTVISSTTASPKVTINKGTKTKYVTLPTAALSDPIGAYVSGTDIIVEPQVTKGYTGGINDYWTYDATTLDTKLVASNIKKDVTIFGVTGTHEGGVATCNVTIPIVDSVGTIGVTATTFANGAVGTFNQSKSSGTFTITNVVCGSIITIIGNSYFSIDGWSGGFGQVSGTTTFYITAPTTAGNYSANIIAYDD